MTFADPLPVWLFVAVCAAVLAVGAAGYARSSLPRWPRGVLAGLRVTTLMLLVFVLMRPVFRSPDPGEAVVAILVDTSRSMSIEDVSEGRRIDQARALVSEIVPALTPRFVPEVLAFGDALEPAAPETLTATARRSDLAGALRAVGDRYASRALAAIVLVSDGAFAPGESNAGPPPHVPLFALGIGSRAWSDDREVLSLTALESVLDDSRIDVAVTAVSHGYGTEPIELRLLENGRAQQVRRIRPAFDGTPVREVFQVVPARDRPTLYTVEIPDAADRVPENDTRSVLVEPRGRAHRVLLLQGAPGYEHSFLRRAWSGDPSLEIDSVIRQGKNEQGVDTFYIQASASRSGALASGFPATLADLFAYDAIVLANVGPGHLMPERQQDLKRFVGQRGGGLLLLGAHALHGQGFGGTPLEELIPLDVRDRRPTVVPASAKPHDGTIVLTETGEAHAVMQLSASPEDSTARWAALPALASVAPLGGPRPGAAILATATGRGGASWPLVAVQRYGEGRSMVFTGEAAWRWRMRLPAADRTYDMFWRQAVRWLSVTAADPVTIVVPEAPEPGETLAIGVVARTPAFEPLAVARATVRVTAPGGGSDEILAEPDSAAPHGPRLASYRAEQPGVYRLVADVRQHGGPPARAERAILVGGTDPEMTDPRLNLGGLQRLAAASGGGLIDARRIADLSAGIRTPQHAMRQPARELWHSPWTFALLLVLLGGEWMLRRRWGLR